MLKTVCITVLIGLTTLSVSALHWRAIEILPEQATALSHADLDSDGVLDLVVVVQSGATCTIQGHRGLVGKWGFATGRVETTPMGAVTIEDVVTTLVTGDFDGDSAADVVAVGRDGLYLVRGRGDGSLATPEPMAVGGRVTAAAAGELGRADGITDLALAVSSGNGHRLLLFEEPRSFVRRLEPEVIELPEAAAEVVITRVHSAFPDVFVVAGSELVVVGGNDSAAARAWPEDAGPRRLVRVALPGAAVGLTAGRVLEDGRRGLAILLEHGEVMTMPLGDSDDPPSWVEAVGRARVVTRLSPDGSAGMLVAASLLPDRMQQLAVVRSDGFSLFEGGSGSDLRRIDLQPLQATAVASWRAGIRATDSLLVATADGVVELAPELAVFFVVDDSDDEADAVIDGVCATTGGVCTLRAAIEEANAAGEWSQISFAGLGEFDTTIFPLSPLPSLERPMMLDGSSHPSGMVEIDGTAAGDAVGITIAGGAYITLRNLSLINFVQDGIYIGDLYYTVGGDIIEGCHVGVDRTGLVPAGNQRGIFVGIADLGVTIGGPSASAGCVVSANDYAGIELRDAAPDAPHRVLGSTIGLTADGLSTAGNNTGIDVDRFSEIGGPSPGEGNVVSGNSRGIRMDYFSATPDGSIVTGTLVGLDPTGSVAMGNQTDGIEVRRGAVTIGGLALGSGNTISANGGFGVDLWSTAEGAVLFGNRVGTSSNGLVALGNGSGGFRCTNDDVIIGGMDPGAGNTISANLGPGISIVDGVRFTIEGNFIGAGAGGATLLGNQGPGIRVEDSSQVDIGGIAVGQGNEIAANGDAGIEIVGGSLFNAIRGNSIHGNGGLGIDLGGDGPTANDPDDVDSGPNRLINRPVVTWVKVEDDGSYLVRYLVDAQPGAADYPLRIELFLADDATSLEGEELLAVDSWTGIDLEAGFRDYWFPPSSPPVTGSDRIVATATDEDGNSSEFGFTVEPTFGTDLFADGFESGGLVVWSGAVGG